MKYKIYERLTDFFRSSLFSKTNIAIVAVMSIVLNIALAGVAYSLHKDFETFLSLYAPVKSEVISATAPADDVTTTLQTSHKAEENREITTAATEPSSDKNSEVTVREESENKEENTSATAESEQSQQGTYYVTNSGTKYHKSSCSYLSKSRISINLSDAKAKGYSPCSRCIK